MATATDRAQLARIHRVPMPKGPATFDHVIFVCTGSDCARVGGKKIARRLKRELKERGLRKDARVFRTKCMDYCKLAPVVSVQPDAQWVFSSSRKDTLDKVLRVIDPNDPIDPIDPEESPGSS